MLISIDRFAAVVSDNDGSAFITKAEFDSLKNNFQAQIDSYNTSIDSKIDGAIAAYLAGIRLSKKRTIKCLWDSEDGAISLNENLNESKWLTNDMYGGVALTGFVMNSATGTEAGIGAACNLSKFVPVRTWGLNIGLKNVVRGTNYSNIDTTTNTAWTTAK